MKRICSLFLLFLLMLSCQVDAADSKVNIVPVYGLLFSGGASMQEKLPSLALMVAQDTDTIVMAWIPGNDGITPVELVQYHLHLSTEEDFTPNASTLKKTVTGVSSSEITELDSNTQYYGRIIADYSRSTSDPSNTLTTKTYESPLEVDPSAVIETAEDLGLGKHTPDGEIYNYYSGGTPPSVGAILFSEDINGGMTIRKVLGSSVVNAQGDVFVLTGPASLTDALDRASISTSFQLFDIAQEAQNLESGSAKIATARSSTLGGGSAYSRIDWNDRLLVAEQTTFARSEKYLTVDPLGDSSIIKMYDPQDIEQSFTATVTAEFEPRLITEAIWGGIVFKELLYARIEAKGTLSLTALAQYNFSGSGTFSREFALFERNWYALYTAGPVPVYQEITLSMGVEVSAEAETELEALAKAELAESVRLGAYYDGTEWIPYIINKEEATATASLDIIGKASAEIRLIPKIEVKFYKVSNASLTVEPYANSSLTVEETTNNLDFLTAHPERLIQITSFDTSLGMESNVAVSLSALGRNWDILDSTCVLGTDDEACANSFAELSLFSLPEFTLTAGPSTFPTAVEPGETLLQVNVKDGTYNEFSTDSLIWEFFPDDGFTSLEAEPCVQNIDNTTTCSARLISPLGAAPEHSVFVSGYGKIGELARQFKEISIPDNENTCISDPQTYFWAGREWMRCDNGMFYDTFSKAAAYCQNLTLGGHSDWRLPSKEELKTLVYCSNGLPTPLNDYPTEPYECGFGSGPYEKPTIDSNFVCSYGGPRYWTSTTSASGEYYYVFFDNGWTMPMSSETSLVRCVR